MYFESKIQNDVKSLYIWFGLGSEQRRHSGFPSIELQDKLKRSRLFSYRMSWIPSCSQSDKLNRYSNMFTRFNTFC